MSELEKDEDTGKVRLIDKIALVSVLSLNVILIILLCLRALNYNI